LLVFRVSVERGVKGLLMLFTKVWEILRKNISILEVHSIPSMIFQKTTLRWGSGPSITFKGEPYPTEILE
jgi:hypothetical protein